MNGKPTIIVGWITSGVIRAEFVRSLLALQIAHLEHWILGGTMDQISSYIDENRNMLVREFLTGTRSNWLLMVDIDMAFNPLAVDRLFPFTQRGEEIIAGIYNTVIADQQGNSKLVPLSYELNPETERYLPVWLDSPRHVDGGPAGFLLLHRGALERIEADHGPRWFSRIETKETGVYYGEDLSFCRRAKESGLKIMAVPKLEIRHLKIVPV